MADQGNRYVRERRDNSDQGPLADATTPPGGDQAFGVHKEPVSLCDTCDTSLGELHIRRSAARSWYRIAEVRCDTCGTAMALPVSRIAPCIASALRCFRRSSAYFPAVSHWGKREPYKRPVENAWFTPPMPSGLRDAPP